jgi:hypothetical protein
VFTQPAEEIWHELHIINMKTSPPQSVLRVENFKFITVLGLAEQVPDYGCFDQ